MGMFDFKNLNSSASAELVSISSKLAIYSNAASFMGFPGARILNWLSSISGNLNANKYDINPPKGWREIEPSELGLSNSVKDRRGYYTFESPVLGKAPIDGMGPQAKIFGEFKNGKVVKISLAFAGTNDLLDIADYFHFNDGKVVPPMNPLLNVVKEYVIAQGLSSNDVIITGYSLGGGLANLAAKFRETLADGFFKDSYYLGFSSPYIYDNPDVIFNMGYENDAVYRILGNEESFKDAYYAAKPGFVNPDKNFASSADNVVMFGKGISSGLWSYKFLSIFNRINGWSAHGDGVRSDAIERIGKSKFYEYTHKDSTVIIDQLPAISRWNTWVKDKISSNHKDYGRPTFIIGNEHNNLLQGNKGGDYIEGKGGHDRIKPGAGADRVDGGEGIDNLVLSGRSGDWNAFRLSDGTLFMHAKNKSGMVQAENIERVEFQSEIMTWSRPYDVNSDVLKDNRFLIKWWNKNVSYGNKLEGTNGDDQLEGSVVFAKSGDDLVKAGRSGSLLHAGEGNDFIMGNDGNDEIYGAEGNDIIEMSKGNDIIYGGIGNDLFVFDKNVSSSTVVKDFNSYSGERDKILFSSELFSSAESALMSLEQKGNNVQLNRGYVSITFENTVLDDFNHSNVGII